MLSVEHGMHKNSIPSGIYVNSDCLRSVIGGAGMSGQAGQKNAAPLSDELTNLVHTISHRIARFLERQGILERDMEQSYLTLEEDDDPMGQIQGHSITYRIAVGAQQGQKVFSLQTRPPSDNESNE